MPFDLDITETCSTSDNNESLPEKTPTFCEISRQLFALCKKLYKKYVVKLNDDELKMHDLKSKLTCIERDRIKREKKYAKQDEKQEKNYRIEEEMNRKENIMYNREYERMREQQLKLNNKHNSLIELIEDLHLKQERLELDVSQIEFQKQLIEQECEFKQDLYKENERLEQENNRLDAQQLDKELLERAEIEYESLQKEHRILEHIQELEMKGKTILI